MQRVSNLHRLIPDTFRYENDPTVHVSTGKILILFQLWLLSKIKPRLDCYSLICIS